MIHVSCVVCWSSGYLNGPGLNWIRGSLLPQPPPDHWSWIGSKSSLSLTFGRFCPDFKIFLTSDLSSLHELSLTRLPESKEIAWSRDRYPWSHQRSFHNTKIYFRAPTRWVSLLTNLPLHFSLHTPTSDHPPSSNLGSLPRLSQIEPLCNLYWVWDWWNPIWTLDPCPQ
jgi:hypothetical protein